MTTEFDPTGSERSTDHATRDPETYGTLTARIHEYFPEATSGLGEPSEAAHVVLTYTAEDDSYSETRRVCVNSLAPQLRQFRITEDKTWVREAWCYEATEDWEMRTSHGTATDLFHYSTKEKLSWTQLLDDVLDNAYLLIT